jgi:hypothetical protein
MVQGSKETKFVANEVLKLRSNNGLNDKREAE